MDCYVQMNQVSLMFGYLGQFLKEGCRANTVIFGPILQGLCWDNRIDEATSMMLEKMPKVYHLQILTYHTHKILYIKIL
jgi:hypothetical protein